MLIEHRDRAANSHLTMRNSRAFTLIELLIVIAIIAILAAILFPVFARARENARRSACQSNLKQIGLGMMQYVQDSDERYPFWQREDLTPWQDATMAYVKSEQVYQCPSSKIPRSYNMNKGREDMTAAFFGERGIISTTYAGVIAPLHTSDISDPAKTVWVGDSDGGTATSWYSTWIPNDVYVHPVGSQWNPHGYRVWGVSGTAPSYYWPERHLERINILYGDGHVKAVKLETLVASNRAALTIQAD